MLQAAYVEDVNRFAVFDRDDWNCYLCDGAIDQDAVVPHPQAATIDHVVALAVGGEHSMANVRAAHFLCNAIKGDRTIKGLLTRPDLLANQGVGGVS
ncbi:HNH endonuclease [Streptodolium elevatio]|uniref:HNH endonuclease n=1 Tax=Streptodolium elevatio TaxID=3157996 RepID=A0ABV3DNX1_9ACTN